MGQIAGRTTVANGRDRISATRRRVWEELGALAAASGERKNVDAQFAEAAVQRIDTFETALHAKRGQIDIGQVG
jgi:hypothetical protein